MRQFAICKHYIATRYRNLIAKEAVIITFIELPNYYLYQT